MTLKFGSLVGSSCPNRFAMCIKVHVEKEKKFNSALLRQRFQDTIGMCQEMSSQRIEEIRNFEGISLSLSLCLRVAKILQDCRGTLH